MTTGNQSTSTTTIFRFEGGKRDVLQPDIQLVGERPCMRQMRNNKIGQIRDEWKDLLQCVCTSRVTYARRIHRLRQ